MPKPWPSEKVIEQIADKSGGYFIYAATVIKYVDEEYFSCLERLDQVLGTSAAQPDPEEMPFAELDKLYNNVLSACPKSQLPVLKRTLAFLGALPKASAIEGFLGLRPGQIHLMLRGLRSIVDVGVDGRLFSFHASFLDFLFDPARAKDYHVDLEQCRTNNFHRLFTLVNSSMPVLKPQSRAIQNMLVLIVMRYLKTHKSVIYSHPIRYNPWKLEACIAQCSRQCSTERLLTNVIETSLQAGSWSKNRRKSFIAATLLLRLINVLQNQVCHDSLRDAVSWSNTFKSTFMIAPDRPISAYGSPHDHTKWLNDSISNDETLLDQLILLSDSGFHFHLSRLVKSPGEHQYIQVLFILDDYRRSRRTYSLIHEHGLRDGSAPKVGLSGQVDHDVYLKALPELLCLPNSASYIDINEFITALHGLFLDHPDLLVFFEGFQRDPVRSGSFYHEPAVWHAFAATRFLRFLAAASSR